MNIRLNKQIGGMPWYKWIRPLVFMPIILSSLIIFILGTWLAFGKAKAEETFEAIMES